LKLKCIKFDFGWGSAPDPATGAHSGSPYPLAGFYRILLLRKEKKSTKEDKGREG